MQKPKESEDIKKRETQYIQNKMLKEDLRKFYRKLGTETTDTREPPLWQKKSLTGSHCDGRKSTA